MFDRSETLKKLMTLFILMCVGTYAYAGNSTSMTFSQVLTLAVKNSPDIIVQQEKLSQARWAQVKTFGGMLPNVNVLEKRQYGYGNELFSDKGWNAYLDIKQPVFYGLSKVNTFLITNNEARKEELNLLTIKRGLAVSVTEAYFSLALAQSNIKNIEDALDLVEVRRKELIGYVNLGKSRKSDLYAIESKSAILTAQRETAVNVLENAKAKMEYVSGVSDITAVWDDTTITATKPDIKAITTDRSDLKAINEELEAQDKRTAIGIATFLPDANLEFTKNIMGTPYLGSSSTTDYGWTIMLNAEWPLFEGGGRIADTASEMSKKAALEQQLLLINKAVKLELKVNYNNLKASIARVRALSDALDKVQKSLKVQENDYRLGLVTNLDVIQAMSDRTDVKTQYDAEKILAQKNKIMLEISSEQIDFESGGLK